MKPVAVRPNISFTQLVEEIITFVDTNTVVDQLIAKLWRRINVSNLSPNPSPARRGENAKVGEEGVIYQTNNDDIKRRLEISLLNAI
ncbi:hypothetical protein DSM106972_031980 [Dulcicalothrix desertica PCC 7102]|uniref:Uncharacterized protein n=2 Tax=Dulcicalothrix desertica TaxID=32056 RepID=A0A433VIT9_9CYAN|nr:hypothetical protein DSM106972_031980 [Dulcicalothrix desertica PCC 7102]